MGDGSASLIGRTDAALRRRPNHDPQTEHGWTATALGGAANGDVFTANVEGDDRMITYSDASEQTFLEIYWNAADGTGYLIAPNFNDGLMACWDANQQDATCS